jgi:rhomboid protease GluP
MNNIKKYFEKSPITSLLIAICVVSYIISFLKYGIEMNALDGLEFGGYNPLYVYVYNEYYRIISSQFIHFGIIHLIMNCYSLFGIGMFIESVFSKNKFLIITISSLIATTGIPYLLFLINGFEANVVSGGISGVVFGMIGALAALAIVYKDVFLHVFKQLSSNLILMLVISFIVPSVSLSGHLSGFVGGFISTYIIIYFKNKKTKDTLLN